jgi:hypothetical protein
VALLTRAQIDNAQDQIFEDVPVPEWGGEVRLLALSGTERDAYEASMVRVGTTGKVSGVNLLDASSRLLAKCIVDENLERLYTDKEVAALGVRNGKVIKRLYARAQKISGLGAAAVEDAAGNSEPAPSGPSTSV